MPIVIRKLTKKLKIGVEKIWLKLINVHEWKTLGGGQFYHQSLVNKGKNHKNLAIDSFCGFYFGFTLIEVIAIIILLSVIALITYPVINNLISDSRDELYDKQISELERLSNTWVTKNIKKLKMEDGYSYNLSFEELHNQGFIVDENIKNPKTGENLDGCVVVSYNSSNKGYDVNYDSNCTITGEIKNPSINLTVNTGILNSQGIATNDFDVNVIGTNITSYTYCVGNSECEPTTKVNNSIGTITINNEGINYVCVIGSSEDKSTNKLCKSYKLEKTAVVLGQLVIDGTKGLNDWYVSDVNLSVVDVAGMTSTLNINKITSDTTGTDVVLTTTASNGKTESKTYTIKVDKTKPTAGTLNINGTKGENDWYISDVTLTVNNGSDTTSGHNTTTSSISSITSDTTGTNVTVTTTDNAGNSSTRTYNIKVDKTAPIAGTLTINGTKGLGEWYLSDVTLTVNNGSDTTSGHASTTSSHTSITSNTTGTIVTVTTKDNAGNTSTRNYTIKINKDKPTEGTLVINGTKGLNDWYVSDVSLSVTDVEGVSSTLNINKITEDTKGTDVIVTSTNTTTGAVTTKTHTIKVDKTKPTAGTLTISGTKGENDWYTSDVTFTVNNGSDTTSGHSTTTSNISSITSDTSGTKVIVTTTDKAGNSSAQEYNIKVDKTPPTVPTVIYNSGANTCNWKNNYNLTLNSTDANGIAKYQIDWDGDGESNHWFIGSNFIPWNEYSSCISRFRAVDVAGNVSEWTEIHHIHMDTSSPTFANSWWGTVDNTIAQLYVQANDDIVDAHNGVGNLKVQCPTSTADGSYNNWYGFDAVWDSSNNAYRCDITPSTFGHYNQTYKTHIYVYDPAGNGGYFSETTTTIPKNITITSFTENGGITTLYNPSSNSTPTILEIPQFSNQQVNAGVQVSTDFKSGDVIEVDYMIDRNDTSGPYMDFIIFYADTNSMLVSGYNMSKDRKQKTFTLPADSTHIIISFHKSDSTSTTYYGKIYIYSITINGEKVL